MNTNIEPQYRPKHLTIQDIKEGCVTMTNNNEEETKLCMIQEEFRQGLEIVADITPSVTFYGSARLGPDHPSYKAVDHLAYRISKELGYAVLSGGGPGIMEAANKGAYDAKGRSVGLTIKLPFEQDTNPYVTDEIPFYFFFARQVTMSYTTEVCIFCPGGFGTFNELFEILTLQQTGKIGKIPVILFGSEFWNPINEIIRKVCLDKFNTINEKDSQLYVITDDEDEILKIIANSKMRDGEDALR
jgi:uncharacterized protein (TIGR00730 family)